MLPIRSNTAAILPSIHSQRVQRTLLCRSTENVVSERLERLIRIELFAHRLKDGCTAADDTDCLLTQGYNCIE